MTLWPSTRSGQAAITWIRPYWRAIQVFSTPPLGTVAAMLASPLLVLLQCTTSGSPVQVLRSSCQKSISVPFGFTGRTLMQP